MPTVRWSSSRTPSGCSAVVTRLTNLYEGPRAKMGAEPWAVSDAPPDFIKSQLRGIVGLRLPITRLDAKRKMSQNRNAQDRAGVVEGAEREYAAIGQDCGRTDSEVRAAPARCCVASMPTRGAMGSG